MDLEKWLHNYRADPSARCRLFCFPYAGGNASVYRSFQGPLRNSGIQVCPVELPGRLARRKEPAFTSMEPLVQALARLLTPFLSRPFAFFGYSMGAVVAFELARHLRRNRLPPPVLVVAAARQAPQCSSSAVPLHELPDDELLARVGGLYGGLPGPVLADPAFRSVIAEILRNDLLLLHRYHYLPGAPLESPILALGGTDDPTVGVDALAAWSAQTCDFRMNVFDGGHFFIHRHGTEICGEVRRTLLSLLPHSPIASEEAQPFATLLH